MPYWPLREESIIPLTNMAWWHEADALVGSLANGDPVTTWADRSPTGVDVGQATAANKPTLVTNAVNGHAALNFDGTNDSLGTSVVNLFVGAWTAFAVVQLDSVSGTHMILDHYTSSSPQIAQILRTNGTAFEAVGTALDAAPTTLTTATWYLVESICTGTTIEALVNGSTNGTTACTTLASGTQDFRYGAFNNGSLFFDGKIAECIGYDVALSGADRGYIRAALTAKYGL